MFDFSLSEIIFFQRLVPENDQLGMLRNTFAVKRLILCFLKLSLKTLEKFWVQDLFSGRAT